MAPLPDYFIAANDLSPEEHVRVQALVQRYTDSSISKTVNAPNDHTVEQVQELYRKAYDYGCKGVTYFRDGCRDGVLSHLEEPPKHELCPGCGEATLVQTEGCESCASCGYAACAV